MSKNPFQHVDVRVSDMALARPFYEKLLPALGFTQGNAGKHFHTFTAQGEPPWQPLGTGFGGLACPGRRRPGCQRDDPEEEDTPIHRTCAESQHASSLKSQACPPTRQRAEWRSRGSAQVQRFCYRPPVVYIPKPTRLTILSSGSTLLTALVMSLALVLKPALLTLSPMSLGLMGVERWLRTRTM